MKNIVIDIDDGLKSYYENADSGTMIRSSDRELEKLLDQLSSINCRIAIVKDCMRLNAPHVRYLKGFSNQDIFKFNSNWYAWKSDSLRSIKVINADKDHDTKNEVSKEYMQYTQKFFLDTLFGKNRKFKVSLYYANRMGWEGYEVMFFFHINNKYTMEIKVPNCEFCNSAKDVEKLNRFKCVVSVAKDLYNKDTNYFKYEFQRSGYDLNLLVNEAFRFMKIELGSDVKLSDQILTYYKDFGTCTIK